MSNNFIMKKSSVRGGFTLIELLVVIAIIGILSSIILVSLSSARGKAKDVSAKGSMSSIRSAAEIYNTGNGYGTAGSGTVTSAGTASGLSGVCVDPGVQKLLTAGAAQSSNTATCVVGLNGASWVAYVTLSQQTSPANFCVDSNGFSGELAAAPAAVAVGAAVKCQ